MPDGTRKAQIQFTAGQAALVRPAPRPPLQPPLRPGVTGVSGTVGFTLQDEGVRDRRQHPATSGDLRPAAPE